LIEAANRAAEGAVVDPLAFELRTSGIPSIRISGEPVEAFDAFIVRGFNRGGDVDYQYEILELLERLGKLVVNSPAGLSVAESKAQTTYCLQESGIPVPRTLVTQDLDEAHSALSQFGEAVLKPLYGSFGIDMERVKPDTAESILPDFIRKHGAIYMQEYIPNEGRDIRAFVVGDHVTAAVYRIAQDGEWKTNVAQGSSCERCELSSELCDLCVKAAKVIGLDYTGVDVMEGPCGPMVLEVNGAPCWQGLLDGTGHNVAGDVVEHLLRMLHAGQPALRPLGF
jgi:RimK family alpha-L-glutamate ligase